VGKWLGGGPAGPRSRCGLYRQIYCFCRGSTQDSVDITAVDTVRELQHLTRAAACRNNRQSVPTDDPPRSIQHSSFPLWLRAASQPTGNECAVGVPVGQLTDRRGPWIVVTFSTTLDGRSSATGPVGDPVGELQ
jgi:hypothetical protein